MKRDRILSLAFLTLAIFQCLLVFAQDNTAYPIKKDRKRSPGKTTYYVDPVKGSDEAKGTKNFPFKSFKNINKLILSAGDKVAVIAPGAFKQSLALIAEGTAKAPVTISFAPGKYDFYNEKALKKQLQISNTNDVPYGWKAIAIYVGGSKHVKLNGAGATLVMRGKMIETFIDSSENISINGLSYDYHRPTVSELTVLALGDNYADFAIHPDSKYSIQDSLMTWEGEGWRTKPGSLWQSLDLATGVLQRVGFNLRNVKYVETGENKVRAYFSKNPGFKKDLVYQDRDVTRDCVGFFMQRSKNISWKDVNVYFMHGMGVVSQFCENISMDKVMVKPKEGSGRTCSAWADILHFASCKGKIEISNSYLSAANDDAINVHGLHLRILASPTEKQLKVGFIHGQTYGFEAFAAGDSIDLTRATTLIPFARNMVESIAKINDKEYLLTLKNAVPKDLLKDDVVENVSWTPSLWAHDNVITRLSTRGMLVTTPRKVVIERNQFTDLLMSPILVENDANGWFESGSIKNMIIKGNDFKRCGGPIINFHPENRVYDKAVHQNISIMDNKVELRGGSFVSANSVNNLLISGNKIIASKATTIEALVSQKNVTGVKIEGNEVRVKE